MSKLPPLNPALEPVWLPYGRKSHPDERDDQKLTEREQRQSCERWLRARIERDGRGAVDDQPWEYDDDTGLNAERPAYRRRLARARELRLQGRQVYWLVRQFDRLGRDAEELHRCYKELCALDVELHDVSMGGYVSPQVFPYLVANAHVGSVTIGANVRRTNSQVRRDGWWRPGRRAWGYAIVPATKEQQGQGSPKVVLALHPSEAAPCFEAWERLAAGENLHQIARWVAQLPAEQRGENPKGARTLGHQALRLVFRNPLYKGEQPDGTPGHWPALVSAELWDKVQAALDRAHRTPAQATGDYLLTGLLWCDRCAACGQASRMRGSGKRKPGGDGLLYRRYECSSAQGGALTPTTCYASVQCDRIERDVLRQVRPLFTVDVDGNRAELAREVARLLGAARGEGPLADLESRLQAAEGKISLARKRSQSALQLREDGEITRDELTDRLAVHRALREEGEREKLSAQAELTELTKGRAGGRRRSTVADVMGQLADFRDRWLDAPDVKTQRAYLPELVERIQPVRGPKGDVRAHITWTEEGGLLAAAAQMLVAPGEEGQGDGADTAAAG